MRILDEGRTLLALALSAFSIARVGAQPAAGASTAPPPNFAIETEMLTYRALESNSEAIACDVAAYLNDTSANFVSPPKGEVCDVKAGSRKATVIVLALDNSQLADFQIWRADMATMEGLERRADADCSGTVSRGAVSAAEGLLSGSGTPLAIAQSVLAMMASSETVSSVVGTIQDQAFMNGVGRELRALRVEVLMPGAYSPFSMQPLNLDASPFLSSFNRILDARECLAGLSGNAEVRNQGRIKQTLADIATFLTALAGAMPAAPAANPQGTQPATQVTGASSSTPPPQSGPAVAPPSQAPSHLRSVLSADGLMQNLGLDLDADTSQHILLVKALESGGAVTKQSNVLGTTVSYSGGSVATYALYKLNGDLECSGNVYDYIGPVPSKNFQQNWRNYKPDPAKQVIFERGGCRASPPNRTP